MFTAYAILALAPILGLGVYCVAHLVACRVVGQVSNLPKSRQIGNLPHGPYFPLVVGCGCGLAATAAISVAALLWVQNGLADGLALGGINLVAYLAFAFGYFNFINLNIASLRIRMLQELADAGGRLPAARLTGLYSTENVSAVRIDRLAGGGHLIERGGRYYSGKWRFLFVARTFDLLRWAILGQKSLPSPSGRGAAGEGISVNSISCQHSSYNCPHPSPLPEGEGTGFAHEPVSQLSP